MSLNGALNHQRQSAVIRYSVTSQERMRAEKCNKTLLLNAIIAMSITLVATVLVFFIYTVKIKSRWK